MTVLTPLELQSLAQVSAASLINTVVEGIGIAILAWTLLRVTARQSSGTRFAVWFFALLGIAALPFVAGSAPHTWSGTVRAPLTISSSWAVYLLAAWAAISAVCLMRLGMGLWQIGNLRRSCEEVDLRTLHPELEAVLKQFAPVRQVKLCISDRVQAPAAVGFFRPAIVLPSWAFTDLSLVDLKVTLLHELAHLRRWDDWTNLFQKVMKAVLFFHPAVWWIEGKLALEREMACDDIVLEQTANPKAYAASLISFAEKIHQGRELALVHALVGRVKQISRRVTRILDSKRPSATRVWRPALGFVTVLSGAALIAAPYAPQLVAFQQAAPAVSTQALPGPIAPVSRSVAVSEPKLAKMPVAPRPGVDSNLIPAKRKMRPTRPRVMLAKSSVPEIPLAEATFVTQSVQYDLQGSPVLTTCFWRVTQDSAGRRTVETTYFVRKI
jgi:beta-lactamase regulating signal transducer with metallopeptidase domain